MWLEQERDRKQMDNFEIWGKGKQIDKLNFMREI